MNIPTLELNLEPIVSKIISNKVLEIFNYIKDLRKIKNFDVEFIEYKQSEPKNGIVKLKVYYKGDLWLKCKQTVSVNGIERIEFVSKYIKQKL